MSFLMKDDEIERGMGKFYTSGIFYQEIHGDWMG